jgi:hypothetical protein
MRTTPTRVPVRRRRMWGEGQDWLQCFSRGILFLPSCSFSCLLYLNYQFVNNHFFRPSHFIPPLHHVTFSFCLYTWHYQRSVRGAWQVPTSARQEFQERAHQSHYASSCWYVRPCNVQSSDWNRRDALMSVTCCIVLLDSVTTPLLERCSCSWLWHFLPFQSPSLQSFNLLFSPLSFIIHHLHSPPNI